MSAEKEHSGNGAGGGQTATRCGFVALIGAPNAGKSTVTNNFVGSKVSIVSPKVQTTRTLVNGRLGLGRRERCRYHGSGG